MRILNVYTNEQVKDSFNTLKYEMTLSDFIALEEYIAISYSYRDEYYAEAEKAAKAARSTKK